ncbi:MAG: hypothetical protein QM576_18285 [Rhodopseudomonas sp.]|uniref:hypothetical protein n=1 Tax=Rhodopseudomonas sp. TaxID=1078 RepID=UPI0039E4AEF0
MDLAAWSAPFDRILHSPNFPILATVAVAVVVALLVLIALLRADKSVASGALVVIALGAIGLAGYALYRTPGSAFGDAAPVAAGANGPAMPALACIDDLAGDMVLSACERALFSSPETVAAAVFYASAQVARLTAFGDVAAADKRMTPELARLRRAVERDRYGLIAYVLASQDRCQASECAAFHSLTDSSRIAANMAGHLYETTLTRYASSWGAPVAAVAGSAGSVQTTPGLAPGLAGVTEAPSGKPTDIDFPTSASIPPVNIMSPEPGQGAAAPAAHGVAPRANPSASAKRPPTATASPAAHNNAAAAPAPAAKRPPTPPKPKPSAPVQLAPGAVNSDN